MIRRVLLTGVSGFIGAHTVAWILKNTYLDIVGIDSWKVEHVNNNHRLQDAVRDIHDAGKRLQLVRWDLTHEFSPSICNKIFAKEIDVIISMASDSRVTASIADPGRCWLNNCQIAYNMLELARKHPPKMFIQVSTDEVYGDANWDDDGHPEWDTILPSNPYSASKAAQEALAISYWRTYNVPVVITNTMNVIGEWQDPAKFLPLAIKRILSDEPMTLYGEKDGKTTSRRVLLDAMNMAAALVHIINNVTPTLCGEPNSRPSRFHIVGDTELSVRELAEKVASFLGKELKANIVPANEIRPGYDRRYALADNNLKATNFKPPNSFDTTLRRVLRWAERNPDWIYE